MTYHKLFKKIKKLEKKNPNFSIIAVNKYEVVSTDNGTEYIRNNLVKIPKIYRICKDTNYSSTLKNKILEIIGE